ncbi:MAG: HAMP domain-containing histidine kinase [Gammaproteobacteria bacterium]|nr:HAMP domain-containing histidine kinase [Gammaproteobacteria bacterium]
MRLLTLGRLWPRSLFGRLALILFLGLAVAHVLSFWLILHERAEVARAVLLSNFSKDLATTVAVLEHVPAAERAEWLTRFERRSYRYFLGPLPKGRPAQSELANELVVATASTLADGYRVTATEPPNAVDTAQLRLHVNLADGTPLTVELLSPRREIVAWMPLVLLLQLALLAVFTWVAVRLATRPLTQLADAADALGPDLRGNPLPEGGPWEVARAAAAFNAMQRRITDHLAERLQILAAVSHDLQTPITRMRLRADLSDNTALRDKLHSDLNVMQALVEEGLAYARSAHAVTEASCRIDLNALLDSLVCDYADAGRSVHLSGRCNGPLVTRPHTLRRIIGNLVDNALKFAKAAEITIGTESSGRIVIAILDRGPGIPAAELKAVLRPFYRLESSRSRETGGTGLGLAVAQQLTLALGGSLDLSNRDGGGLEARLSLPPTI